VHSFVGECLAHAGGDEAKLTWSGAQKEVAAYRRVEAEQLRRAQEEEARRAKEEAAQAALAETYVVASVFAAGRCNFSNCASDGWSSDTAAGSVRVRCNFSKCLSDGWVAELPGNKSARTRCNFGDCFKDGWDTE